MSTIPVLRPGILVPDHLDWRVSMEQEKKPNQIDPRPGKEQEQRMPGQNQQGQRQPGQQDQWKQPEKTNEPGKDQEKKEDVA